MSEYYYTPSWPQEMCMFEPGRLRVVGGSCTSFDVQDMKSSYILLASDIQLVMFGVALRAITLFQLLLRAGHKGSLAVQELDSQNVHGGLLVLRNNDEAFLVKHQDHALLLKILHVFIHVPFLADTSRQ